MPVQRVLQGTACTLTAAFADSQGSPADPASPVTVHVTRADGTDLVATGSAATVAGDGTGTVSVNLTAAQTGLLDQLTATWAAPSGQAITSHHEICGGFFFSVAEARASDPVLANPQKYSDADILRVRQEVEEECELICDVAFVPRYRRVTLSGSGTNELLLPANRLRTIRAVRIYPSSATADIIALGAYVDLDATNLAAIVLDEDVVATRTNWRTWDVGLNNVIVGYEHGYDYPPSDLKRAALIRLRSRLNLERTGIPDRAVSFSAAEGGTYRLDLPSVYKTGIPEVDSTYDRWSKRTRNDSEGVVPASRTLRVDANRFSLFHGGRH